jgi:hypothetical protein
MQYNVDIIAIAAILLTNIIGWAYTIGKASEKAKAGDRAREALAVIVESLRGQVASLDQKNGILVVKVQAIDDTLHNGIVSRINSWIEIQARMDERLKDLEEKQ